MSTFVTSTMYIHLVLKDRLYRHQRAGRDGGRIVGVLNIQTAPIERVNWIL